MANRYWVGGTGTWDESSTTHWSTSSGGAGGASVPTGSDAVFFNASSGGGTVTLAMTPNLYCGGINTTGFTGVINASFYSIYTQGNATIANGTVNSTFRLTFITNATLTMGSTVSFGRVTVGDGVTLTLGSNILIGGLLLLQGNTCSVVQGSYQIGSAAAPIDGVYIGNSSSSTAVFNTGTGVTYSNRILMYGSNITGSGTINLSSGGTEYPIISIQARPAGAGSISATINIDCQYAYGAAIAFESNNNSFTFSGPVNLTGTASTPNKSLLIRTYNAATTNAITFSSLNMNGSATSRGIISAGTYTNNFPYAISYTSSRPVITFTSAAGLNYCDFVSINSATAIAPTSAGNGGNNTNITFTGAVTRYAIPGGGRVWNSTSSWSTSSGGAGGASIPLPQDTAIFDANSGSNGSWASSFAPIVFVSPAITATNFVAQLEIPGGYTFITKNIIPPSAAGVGVSISQATFNATTCTATKINGTYARVINNANATLNDVNFNTVYIIYGTLTLLTNLVCRNIYGPDYSDPTAPITFNMGPLITFYYYAPCVVDFSDATTKTFSGSPNIVCTGSTNYGYRLLIKGVTSVTWGNVTLQAYGLEVYGSQTFGTMTITNSSTSTASNVYFEQGKTYTISGWAVTGNASQKTVITSHSGGSPSTSVHYLSYSGAGYASSGYLDISYSSATPANTWYAGSTSTDSGNNTNWIFANAPTGSNNLFFGSNF